MARSTRLVLATLALGLAGWRSVIWFDDPPDATCGSLWRPDHWLDRSGCHPTVALSLAIMIPLVAIAVVQVLRVLRGSRT